MPLLDMPLQELKNYRGISPIPTDLDEYWEQALKEMEQTDPQVELIPSGFTASYCTCYDMYYTGVHGARIYAKLLIPTDQKKKHPAVLHFHGYSGSSDPWTTYLPYAAEGFIVAAMDCRGQGGRSEDVGGVVGNTLNGHIIRGLDGPVDHLLFRDIFLDTAELAKIIMGRDDVDETRVGAFGGSQGGALTVACASLTPQLNRASFQYPFLSDYRRVWEMDMAERAYAELKEYFRRFDPRHEREDEIFYKLGYIDIQNIAPRIRSKCQMFTGLMDNICPPSTQFAAYNKITSEKESLIYPDFGHEGLPESPEIIYRFMMEMKS